MQALLDQFQELRDHPMGAYIMMTYATGALLILGVIWVHYLILKKDLARRAKYQAALANAKPVHGKISRFGAAGADEYSVDYTFTLEGDSTVYQTSTDYLSRASHGALTRPGDVVTFNVIPGYTYVHDFYNAAMAGTART